MESAIHLGSNSGSFLRRLGRRRELTTYLLCLIWALVVCIAYRARLHPLVMQELVTVDYRFQMRGPQPPPSDIVILAIDQDSCSLPDRFNPLPSELERLRQFKYPRSVYADAITRLRQAGTKVVALDLLFFSPTDEDEQLQQVIARESNHVVLGSNFSDDSRQLLAPEVVVPEAILMKSVAGYVNFWPDLDGKIRRGSFQVYRSETAGTQRSAVEQPELSFDALTARKANPLTAQTEVSQASYINFPGPSGTFLTIPFYQLFYTKTWTNLLQGGAVFRDRIVLVGPTGNFHHDQHATPFGIINGIEIHAAALSTLRQQNAPRDASPWWGWSTALLLALATAALLNRTSQPFLKLAVLVTLGGAYFAAAQSAFVGGIVVWVAAPLWVVAGCGIGGLSLQVLTEQLEKRRVRQTLEKYVSKPVADEILRQGETYEQSLDGQRKPVTILFSDIRGFTALTEEAEPVELVAQLNEYFTAMTEIVMKHGGTLSKFNGDSIMAIYGAPLSAGVKEDAWRAMQTAHQMRHRLKALQEQWTKQNRPVLRIGIGLDHGMVLVGNIGSLQRMEYTVIGSAVNVAARVEKLNKELGTDVLLTEAVYALVRDRVTAELTTATSVRGRAQKIRIYLLQSLTP